MKTRYLTFAIIGLIALIAILTNPDQERHKEVIKGKLSAEMQKITGVFSETKKEKNKLGQVLGVMLGGTLADKLMDNLISTDNYVLFSTTKVTWDGKTNVIGIGAFGNVFLIKELDEITNLKNLKSEK